MHVTCMPTALDLRFLTATDIQLKEIIEVELCQTSPN